MNEINRIVVTGDVLRQRQGGGSSQNANIRWLFHQVSPALEMLLDIPVDIMVCTDDAACLGTQLYGANRLPVSYESWVKLFNRRPSPRDLGIIWQHLDGALVVSFELPEFIRQALDTLNIPYVDLTVHPVRFLDDLAFGLRSSIPGLAQALEPHVLRGAEIFIGAGQARSTMAKLAPIPACSIGNNLALFAGQTADDKVLIDGQRFLDASDFLDRFAQLSADHEAVLVKPHPLAKTSSTVMALTRLFPNTAVVDSNFYHLLSQDSISHVYSVTSSTSIEASYFGKQGVHLGNYPYVFSEDCASDGNYLSIHPDFYLPTFWAATLSTTQLDLRTPPSIRVSHQRSRMRQTLRSYWGAKIFEEAS